MTKPNVYGHIKSGRAITDRDVGKLAAEAEAGYDVDGLIARRNKRGRPMIGASRASPESIRLTPNSGASCSSELSMRALPRRS